MPMPKTYVRSTQCLEPGCSKFGRTRGLCYAHYSRVRALVKSGETTWEGLEEAGRVLRSK